MNLNNIPGLSIKTEKLKSTTEVPVVAEAAGPIVPSDDAIPIKEMVEKYGINALDFLDILSFSHKGCGGRIIKNGNYFNRCIDKC